MRALSRLGRAAACLLMLYACNPQVKKPPPVIWPSLVITRDGMAYDVQRLRMTGTTQELRLKQGETTIWVPLQQVDQIRFSGQVRDRFRPVLIVLTTYEKLEGEIFVDFLIEGVTDQGYWNISMTNVESLVMGTN
jgi:hypothetical protein